MAGLKKYLSKEDLRGRKAVFVANMKPAKLRGELSEAMILAVDDGVHVGVLETDKTSAGEEVHFEDTENASAEITFEDFLKVVMEVRAGKVWWNRKNYWELMKKSKSTASMTGQR